MVSVTIRHVPEDTRDRLAERAGKAGQSLQEYLLSQLVDAAAAPAPDDFPDAVRRRVERSTSRVTSTATQDVLDEVRADR